MKCVLNGHNAGSEYKIDSISICVLNQFHSHSRFHFFQIIVLAKAIHSFARIGCELYLEFDSHSGLSLRTVNMTKSAFASISFNRDFFSSFIVKSQNIEENQCKLSMKSCVGVFRNMKQVSFNYMNQGKSSFHSNVHVIIVVVVVFLIAQCSLFSGGNMYNFVKLRILQVDCAVSMSFGNASNASRFDIGT